MSYDLDNLETLDAQGIVAALRALREALATWEKVATSGEQYGAHRKATLALGVLRTTPGIGAPRG